MSTFTKTLVVSVIGLFAALALYLVYLGSLVSAATSLAICAVLSPLLLEVLWPGRYVLESPKDGSADTMPNRIRQFVKEHPGWDGKALALLVVLPWIVTLCGLGYGVIAKWSH